MFYFFFIRFAHMDRTERFHVESLQLYCTDRREKNVYFPPNVYILSSFRFVYNNPPGLPLNNTRAHIVRPWKFLFHFSYTHTHTHTGARTHTHAYKRTHTHTQVRALGAFNRVFRTSLPRARRRTQSIGSSNADSHRTAFPPFVASNGIAIITYASCFRRVSKIIFSESC